MDDNNESTQEDIYEPVNILPDSELLFEGSESTEKFTSSIISLEGLDDISLTYKLTLDNGKSLPLELNVKEEDNTLQLYWDSPLSKLFPMKLIKYLYQYEQSYKFYWEDVPKGAALIQILFDNTTKREISLQVTYEGKRRLNQSSSEINSQKDSQGELPIEQFSKTFKVILTHNKDDDTTKMLKIVSESERQYNDEPKS